MFARLKKNPNVFVIIPLEDPGDDFIDVITAIDPAAYTTYAPAVYFVRFDGLVETLAERVGFVSKKSFVSKRVERRTGVIICASRYYGLAKENLWEWLRINGDFS